jgi:hypothetical protein
MLNILVRTSKRPKSFLKLMESLKSQTFQNYKLIVGTDDRESLNYIKNFDIQDIFFIDKEKILEDNPNPFPKKPTTAPYNLYMNFLQDKVLEGWIMYIDDDDYFIDENSLLTIFNEIQKSDKDTLIIWSMKFSNGFIVPKKNDLKRGPIQNFIGSPCFTFHVKYKQYAKWDQWRCSDFRVVNKLWEVIPKKNFMNKILVYVPNANGGKEIEN